MEKILTLGKIDYNNSGRKNCLVTYEVEIEARQKETRDVYLNKLTSYKVFTMSADVPAYGQVLETSLPDLFVIQLDPDIERIMCKEEIMFVVCHEIAHTDTDLFALRHYKWREAKLEMLVDRQTIEYGGSKKTQMNAIRKLRSALLQRMQVHGKGVGYMFVRLITKLYELKRNKA